MLIAEKGVGHGRNSWGFTKQWDLHILKSSKKASLYFRAPPNFVHLPCVVPPSSNFPSALLPVVLHFFSLLTIIFSYWNFIFLHPARGWVSYVPRILCEFPYKAAMFPYHLSILSLGCCLFITYIFPFLQYLSGHVSFQEAKKRTELNV